VFLGGEGLEPAKERGGFQAEVDEAGAGERDVIILLQRVQFIDDLLAEGTGVLLFAFGEGEGAVGLEITVGRVGHPHLGLEAPVGQTELGGGGPEGGVEVAGDVEGQGHRVIEELRLALSKNDFGGLREL